MRPLALGFLWCWIGAQSAPVVVFDGKGIEAGRLPESVPKAVRETAARLEPFATKHSARLYVAAGDPALVVLPAGFASAPATLQKLRAAREDFEKRFAPLPPEACLEVAYLEDKAAFSAYVDALVAREDYLKGWAPGAKETPGFWLHRPLAAAYWRDPKDPKEKKAEFNVQNQLVHQLGHLLGNATFGRQPYWVQEAAAWSVEQAQMNTIYAFCHRSGFVFKKEHGGWPKLGRATLAAGGAIPLDKILGMDRSGDIPKETGAASMALVDHLAAKRAAELKKLLASFRAEYEGKNDPAHKIPIERQKELFEAALGAGAAKALAAELR